MSGAQWLGFTLVVIAAALLYPAGDDAPAIVANAFVFAVLGFGILLLIGVLP